jgi:hypothetical protein
LRFVMFEAGGFGEFVALLEAIDGGPTVIA